MLIRILHAICIVPHTVKLLSGKNFCDWYANDHSRENCCDCATASCYVLRETYRITYLTKFATIECKVLKTTKVSLLESFAIYGILPCMYVCCTCILLYVCTVCCIHAYCTYVYFVACCTLVWKNSFAEYRSLNNKSINQSKVGIKLSLIFSCQNL